ncbi:MAG: AAA family ATPase [Chitinophagaceae bacterium]
MKIRALHIESFRHLKDLRFEFVYPDDHSKAGEPLEKICFIGQSATGKTSILELIKDNFKLIEKIEVVNGDQLFHPVPITFKGYIGYTYGEHLLTISDKEVMVDAKSFSFSNISGGAVGNPVDHQLKLIYITAEILTKATLEIFNTPSEKVLEKIVSEKYRTFKKRFERENYFVEFSELPNDEIWYSLIFNILDYRRRYREQAAQWISDGDIANLALVNKKFLDWASTNENPLSSFSAYFNSILSKLNLIVDLQNSASIVPIKSKSTGEVLSIEKLSTGTRNLLISMFPFFEIDTDDSIILIDEPERSLFPDVQIDLISNYKTLAPNSQLIVATHSPFIASAFEPEERFVLYFSDDGIVKARNGLSPIGDDPNDILKNDFQVDYYNEFGKKAYRDYLKLRELLAKEKEPEKKRKLLLDLTRLGDKYNFS